MQTAARRRAIRRIIGTTEITSQQQLVELLEVEGFASTQATISRDLKDMHALKLRGEDGRLVYTMRSPRRGDQDLDRVLAGFVEQIAVSGDLVVLKTPPGAAQVVAAAIDRAGLSGVLGSVAGDDTVLVVAEGRGGEQLARNLEQIGAG